MIMKKQIRWLPGAVLFVIWTVMFILNMITPLIADDFFFSCRLYIRPDGMLFPEGRLRGVLDILVSIKNSYVSHSGRVPVQFLVQFSTLLPETVFDLANSFAFVALVAAIARLAVPAVTDKNNAFALSAAFAALVLWEAPAFGQDYLWQTGAVNYLWTITVTVVFLTPFYNPNVLARSNQKRAACLWFAVGLLSGWSMENQSAMGCAVCLLATVYRLAHHDRRRGVLIGGTAGQLLGFALLMAAPGNYRRSAGYGQTGIPLGLIPARTAQYTLSLWNELWWLVIPAVLLAVYTAVSSKGRDLKSLGFLGAALLCHASMVVSPSYPMRTMLGTMVFLLITVLYSIHTLCIRKCVLSLICVGMLIAILLQLPAGMGDLLALRHLTDARSAYIDDQLAAGNRDITVPIAQAAKTRFHPLWGDALSDLMQNPENERNVSLAFYYGADTIRGDPNPEPSDS